MLRFRPRKGAAMASELNHGGWLVMGKVKLDLEHCYGIKKLEAELDFTGKNAVAIYAPNGMMKSSLAKTFADLAKGAESSDRIHPELSNKRTVLDEQGNPIPPEQVFVVPPFDRSYRGEASDLLVNKELREKHGALLKDLERAKDALLKALKKQAQAKRDLEREISEIVVREPDDLREALRRLQNVVAKQQESALANIAYEKVFDPKALEIITKTPQIQEALGDYITHYNQLLAASTFFKKGRFDLYNAGHVAKTLTAHGFFAASHTVTLNDPSGSGQPRQVTSQEELEAVILEEKERIMKDPGLRKRFKEVEDLLHTNDTGRKLEDYLMENEHLLPEMGNVEKFKEKVLVAYLKANEPLYQTLLAEYEKVEQEEKTIFEQAKREQTRWESVIEQFNARFSVPFVLSAANKIDMALGRTGALHAQFQYKDGDSLRPVDEKVLLPTLSTGEEKAFYVLQLLFDVETKRLRQTPTLMIVDDIADSFDYQNKYAIIQYLKEISEDGLFRLIILTHNFDFFRTCASRDVVGYGNCFMATKHDGVIKLAPAWGIVNNVFANWKSHFFDDPKKRIAAIPFLRNLAEYMLGRDDSIYTDLTSLLHWKDRSQSITEGRLDEIYNTLFGTHLSSAGPGQSVVENIFQHADECLPIEDGTHFENKIVLSIAIRLCAERYMVLKINDPAFVATIKSNQSPNLLKKFKEISTDVDAVKAMGRVLLMTPENIHLNSFMYEPIIDMSDSHLKQLYRDCRALK